MKWRIVLAVLFVLTLFGAFAYLYVNTFVRKRQHAVILFVVNGLDLNLLNQARQQLGRGPLPDDPDDPGIGDARRRVAIHSEELHLDSFWNVALMGVQQPGQPVPDEGADATALACGQRVENGYVATNSRGETLTSLIYAAQQASRATGLVTTSSLVAPTPVAFYSYNKVVPDPYRNAADLLDLAKMDIVLGGGASYFTPANATNERGRHDNRNLLDEAKALGYTTVRTRDELNHLAVWRSSQVFGLFAPGEFYFSSLQPANTPQPTLAEMTSAAIARLNNSYHGYFLVVEDGLVARAASQNLGKLAINEVAALDEAVQTAVDYAGPDALIAITDNYSLGAIGPVLPVAGVEPPVTPTAKSNAADDIPVAPIATTMAGFWATGPGGPARNPAQVAWLKQHYASGEFSNGAPGFLQPQPAFQFQPEASALAGPAWLLSRGEGSAQLRGCFNNTDLFDLLTEQF